LKNWLILPKNLLIPESTGYRCRRSRPRVLATPSRSDSIRKREARPHQTKKKNYHNIEIFITIESKKSSDLDNRDEDGWFNKMRSYKNTNIDTQVTCPTLNFSPLDEMLEKTSVFSTVLKKTFLV